jgi:AraC-like DNA-binding protein
MTVVHSPTIRDRLPASDPIRLGASGFTVQSLTDPPLISCDRFATSDPDEAVTEATRVLAPHQMDVWGDHTRFRARGSRAILKDTSVCHINYESQLGFHIAPQNMFTAVVLPLSGDTAISYGRGDEFDVPLGSIAVVPSGCRLEFQCATAFSMLIVHAQTSALSAGLRRIAPEIDTDDLRFDPVVAADGAIPGTFFGLSSMLVGIVDQYKSPSLIPSTVVDTMSAQVISTFLLGLPHSRTAQMLRNRNPISRRVIKLAVDMVVADEYAQYSVSDIATSLGISLRSLEMGFRKELGCTPYEYVRKFRLQRAYDQLCHAHSGDGTTVTDVAMRWGFNHAGRFASLFRRVYGVAPSAMLRAS